MIYRCQLFITASLVSLSRHWASLKKEQNIFSFFCFPKPSSTFNLNRCRISEQNEILIYKNNMWYWQKIVIGSYSYLCTSHIATTTVYCCCFVHISRFLWCLLLCTSMDFHLLFLFVVLISKFCYGIDVPLFLCNTILSIDMKRNQ